MGQLDGKIAIVTGTSRGVGVGIAKRLLEEGATVAGCSRR
jgi:NAD(P)-dependent dehydrogenase (short-subunit alcohol dehydrogenase family)